MERVDFFGISIKYVIIMGFVIMSKDIFYFFIYFYIVFMVGFFYDFDIIVRFDGMV